MRVAGVSVESRNLFNLAAWGAPSQANTGALFSCLGHEGMARQQHGRAMSQRLKLAVVATAIKCSCSARG
jgi:hypothetical protein